MGSTFSKVNYSSAKDRRASGFIDSTHVNASSRFCLASDLVPKPDLKGVTRPLTHEYGLHLEG